MTGRDDCVRLIAERLVEIFTAAPVGRRPTLTNWRPSSKCRCAGMDGPASLARGGKRFVNEREPASMKSPAFQRLRVIL
jgi:hypothetical protein